MHARLEETLEELRALCEPVDKPHGTAQYMAYFCGSDPLDEEAVKDDQEKRSKLYKLTRSLIRTYAEIAPDLDSLGYTSESKKPSSKKCLTTKRSTRKFKWLVATM